MATAVAPLNEVIPDVYVTDRGVHRFAPTLSQEARQRILEQNLEMDRAEREWTTKGCPWTEDDESFLERMTGY